MKAREGDLIETHTGIIFDVKGLIHPPRKVIAFPRFIPTENGERRRKGKTAYNKIYALSVRIEFLERNIPQYLVYDPVFDEKLCEVPWEDIKHHYKPANRLENLRKNSKLDALESDALNFLKILKKSANISWNKLGISGSILTRLHEQTSDIDPVVYGDKNCRKVYETLKTLMQDQKSEVKQYSTEELKKLYAFRHKDTKISLNAFLRTENRKVLQGTFKGHDYFLRLIKDWSETKETYGSICYKNVGYAKIKAEVEDDSEAIFTPCSYKIKETEVLGGTRDFQIEEIVSFRGRFCEQARKDEKIIARGKIEKVTNKNQNHEHFRLLIGNEPSDFMILA
ncbi:MAG: hypothetical protein QXM86_04320 [Candidatus Bathyarchaeia archaeon]